MGQVKKVTFNGGKFRTSEKFERGRLGSGEYFFSKRLEISPDIWYSIILS
jgi:hypothetical protein